MRYSLLVHYQEMAPGELDEAEIQEGEAAFQDYAKALADAGVLISAEVLQPSTSTTTVTMRGGQARVQDGPFADTKEQFAGSFVIEVPDLDAALAWAERCPAAHWGSVEIRPSAVRFENGAWIRG